MTNFHFADRINAIKASATLTISNRAKELQDQGKNIIALSAGEPDFSAPQTAVDAGIDAFKKGFTHYTLTPGIVSLRQAIAEHMKKDFSLTYRPEEISVGAGAKCVLYHLFQILLNPGDEVIIPSPYWVSYPDQVILAGGKPIVCDTKESEGFVVKARDLEKLVTNKTRVLVLNFPSNPSGGVMGEEDLKDLAQFILRHKDLVVISDEIYALLVYDGFRQASIAAIEPKIFERVIVVNGMSKTYAMTGCRIGWAAGPEPIIKNLNKLQGQTVSNASSIEQKAAEGALRGSQEILTTMTKSFDERRLRMLALLSEIPGISCLRPKGAFYCFPNFSHYYGKTTPKGEVVTDSVALCNFFLDEAMVALVPGTPFGAPAHVRLSFATSMANIEEALKRIKTAVSKLR